MLPQSTLKTLLISLFISFFSLSQTAFAQTESFYRFDTTKVLVTVLKTEGFLDTVYTLKPNTMRNGQAVIFYDEALKTKAMECHYRRFIHQGIDVYYYPDGTKQKKAAVREGICIDSVAQSNIDSNTTNQKANEYWCKQYCGNFSWWYPDGQIRAQGTYNAFNDQHCIKSGQWYFWYPSGTVERVISYNETGLKHGKYREYYKGGMLKIAGEYFADAPQNTSYRHGTWQIYDLEGQLITEFRYLLGLRVKD